MVVDGEYENASSLNFYTGIPLRILHQPSGNLWYGMRFPDAPQVWKRNLPLTRCGQGPIACFFGLTRKTQKNCMECNGMPWRAAGVKRS